MMTRKIIYTLMYAMRMRSRFAVGAAELVRDRSAGGFLLSAKDVDVSRSPFVKAKVRVLYDGVSLESIIRQLGGLEPGGASFKVVFVEAELKLPYEEKLQVEREVGANIGGRADMRKPEKLYGIAYALGRWRFGEYTRNDAVWLRHKDKPQNYSTALSTRMARAAANIAVPDPAGIKAIDPCCGIGTVLIEAHSMGIDIVGCDMNPLAVQGARANLAHFGFPGVVELKDMKELSGRYDAAILDLPYNLCSVISEAEQLSMLQSARRLAGRAVIITTEPIDSLIESAGFRIHDRCAVRKGSFSRQLIVCQ